MWNVRRFSRWPLLMLMDSLHGRSMSEPPPPLIEAKPLSGASPGIDRPGRCGRMLGNTAGRTTTSKPIYTASRS